MRKKLLTTKQLSLISDVLLKELKNRGIPINEINLSENEYNELTGKSETFETSPMVHKSLRIVNDSLGVQRVEKKIEGKIEKLHRVMLALFIEAEGFDNKKAKTFLFSFWCDIFKETKQ